MLDLGQITWCLAITAAIISGYFLGRAVEKEEHEQRERRLARIQRGQRASG
jgi:hypothetical protein